MLFIFQKEIVKVYIDTDWFKSAFQAGFYDSFFN